MSGKPIANGTTLSKSPLKSFAPRSPLPAPGRGLRSVTVFTLLTLLVVALAACQPAGVVPAVVPTIVVAATPRPAATTAPAATAAPAGTVVNVASDAKLGQFLVDAKGMTLYLFTKDTNGESVCYDQCATAWPPLLTTGTPVAGPGVTGTLGVTTRKDGTQQVTYNGMPLYYYITDMQPGDTTGQDVGGVWFVVPPVAAAKPTPAPTADDTGYGNDKGGQAPGNVTVMVGETDALGKFLVDGRGMTLYLFTKDTANTSTCYDQCATNWPPLLVAAGTTPVAQDDAPGKLGVTTRTDGTRQVTYDGWPLYYFAKDAKAGDTNGQGVGSVWFVVPPTGGQMPSP